MTDPKSPPIAIIGVGTLFPGSSDAHGFWRDILDGKDLISDIPEDRWLVDDFYDKDQSIPDKTYGKRGGFIGATDFDPMAFGIPPNVLEATDSSQLLALIVAQQVLQDAWGSQFQDVDKSKMSVILGVTAGQELMNEMASRLQRPIWVKSLRELGYSEDEVQAAADRIAAHYTPWQENTFPGLLGNVVAGRIANRFDFGGTNCVTDAACASALSAISLGLNELYLGHSDVVICGGVDTFNDIFMYMCFSKTPALSPTGDCRPFSDTADGTILGEGLAMFALKRLDDAERDGDNIYGVIRGSGSSSDGKGKAIYAPDADGQSKAILRAYERAGYSPDSVELVEAHGTGTKAGDAAEFEGLCRAFSGAQANQIALGSIKSQIGHTKSTAGAAGFFKILMAVHHRVLPPTIKVESPSKKLGISTSPFYINTETRPWINTKSHPRRAGVSAFGFGGSNFHLTLEEYVGENKAAFTRRDSSELFLFSAATSELLNEKISKTLGPDFAAEAKRTRLSFNSEALCRLAIVANTPKELRKKIQQAMSEIPQSKGKDTYQFKTPNGLFYHVGKNEIVPKNIALLFPGQGSQSVNMSRNWMTSFPQMSTAWESELVSKTMDGTRLIDVIFPRPKFTEEDRNNDATRIRSTEWAQPALGLTSMAFKGLLDSLGIKASSFAGHSYGELSALWAAGTMTPEDLIALSRERGTLMANASKNDGAMTAVATDLEQVRNLIGNFNVVVANHNGRKQVVVSGPTADIQSFENHLKDESITFRRLEVATAFHSPIVEEAATPFTKFASKIKFKKTTSTVYSNVLAAPYGTEKISELLGKQIVSPVRWVEMIEKMVDDGTTLFVECGSKTVLTKLTQRIVGKRATVVGLDHKGRQPWQNLWMALAEFSALGMKVDFSTLDTFETTPVKEKSKMDISITGANYKKPYPPKGGSAALPKPNVKRKNIVSNDTPKPKSNGIAANQNKQNGHPVAQPQLQNQVPYWVVAFQESQRQMAQAHTAYQQSMAQAHTSFLNVLAQSQASMAAMAGVQGMQNFAPIPAPQFTPPASPQFAPPTQPVFQPPAYQPPQSVHAPVQTNGMQAPTYTNGHANGATNGRSQVYTNGHSTNGHATNGQSTIAQAAIVPAPPRQTTQTQAAPISIETLLFKVIAEKTGYPVETLNAEMGLESDLGIDSIKRVEILSAITDQASGLENIDPSEMSTIATIGGILDFLEVDSASSLPIPATVSTASTSSSFETTLLEVVADKTGYPTGMLNLEMKLEGDLGIDSIKRVEILSAVSDKLPSIGELDGTEMADLSTLKDIVSFVEGREKK